MPQLPSQPPRVWVVDDDRAVRFVLAQALRDAGYAVAAFEGAREALAALVADAGQDEALPEVETLFTTARENLRGMVTVAGKVSSQALEDHQYAAHALAWLATYTESLRQMDAWAHRIQAEGKFTEMEALILQIGFGEYLSQIHGGIPMSQGEIARLQDLRVTPGQPGAAVVTLMAQGNTPAARSRLVELMRSTPEMPAICCSIGSVIRLSITSAEAPT